MVICSILLIGINTFAQGNLVKGFVKDENGLPMPGVTVILKGTTTGTLTDINGNYSINVTGKNDVLVFSFVGYKTQELDVQGRALIDVVLILESKELEEVIVVGYGTQSKYNVTGSIASIDLSKIASLPTTNITQSLSGVPGVQFTNTGRPGQTGAILIRGQNSLIGSNDPLIILDGITFSGSLSDINPDDIQSIQVLKDASSASIYGSRAANGVILVTSKKGITEKPAINFNAFYGLSDVAHELKLLSAERYIERRLQWRKINNQESFTLKIHV